MFFANLAWLFLNLFSHALGLHCFIPSFSLPSSNCAGKQCPWSLSQLSSIQPLGLVPSLELIAFAQLPQLLLASEIPSSQPAAPTAPQSSGLHGFKRLTFSFKVTFLFLHICSKFAMAILAVPPL